jgi:hypothetical protein
MMAIGLVDVVGPSSATPPRSRPRRRTDLMFHEVEPDVGEYMKSDPGSPCCWGACKGMSAALFRKVRKRLRAVTYGCWPARQIAGEMEGRPLGGGFGLTSARPSRGYPTPGHRQGGRPS